MTGSLVSAGTRERVRGMAIPIAIALGRLGLTPNALTFIGFIGTCVAAWAAASQLWLLAGVLVLVFGIFDLFDGTLARATGRATRLGAFLDSTFDRVGEAIVYIGIAAGSLAAGFWFGALLSMTAMAAAFLVSYVRAKAESLGFSSGSGMAAIGLAPREVRIAILTVGLIGAGAFGPIGTIEVESRFPLGSLAVWNEAGYALGLSLGLITVLGTLTVVQRVLHVRSQAKEG